MSPQLQLECLEGRDVPSASLLNGTLFVMPAGIGPHTVSVDRMGDAVQVNVDGQVDVFDAARVNNLFVKAVDGARNVIQNNTAIGGTLLGGTGKDTIFGGTGMNVIDPGKGDDTVYALLGTNVINARGQGKDRVFTNFGAAVNAGNEDQVVRFFGPGRAPGQPFIGFDNTLNDGVLYITPSNNGSYVVLEPLGGNKVLAIYDLGDSNGLKTATFKGVKTISYFGGAGNDTYINNTFINEAAYGSAGNDFLLGGRGDFTLLKGSGGNDVLIGRAKENDLSGNGGADTLFAFAGRGRNVFRTDALDTILGRVNGDITVTP